MNPYATGQPWASSSTSSGWEARDARADQLPTPTTSALSPVIDLTGSDAADNEPPNKRLKLDTSLAGSGTHGQSGGRAWESRITSGNWFNARLTIVGGRNRPVYSFQDLLADPYGGINASGSPSSVSQSGKPPSPPPLPVRPWRHTPSQGEGALSKEPSPEREVQTTPYQMTVPEIAPVLKDSRVADFSPWMGNHPEDVLNDQTMKHGYFDRPQLSHNETSTARNSLYSQMKNRSGLQKLSSLFSAALEKREAHNKVRAASTFKPPPRVTLTDNKREAWLRDLANSDVPLRRLSRTIPHGIRGKVLLDQCLSKWVPIGRAVWLAKCVGANEIRAFKRKGTSGSLTQGLEVKWVREWTSSVQQFLEGVIASCGQDDWKPKFNYSARLIARLFVENLVDQDFYLEWYLSCLENASLESFPIWMLLLGIHWEYVVRFRKRGRRVAEILLEKLRQSEVLEPKQTYRALNARVSALICRLVRESPSSLVLSASWERYGHLVSSALGQGNDHETAFKSLQTRNLRVQKTSVHRHTPRRSSRQQVIRLLDTSRFGYDIPALSQACLTTELDREALVAGLLEWTATRFRHGLDRVYIAARLLRRWKNQGLAIESYILLFLSRSPPGTTMDIENVYHVVVELIRSQTFSVGRYLQWLVSRGAIERSQHQSPSAASRPHDIELLRQIPAHRLPHHLLNFRNSLMARAGLSFKEADVTRAVKARLRRQAPLMFRQEVEMDGGMDLDISEDSLTWSVKSEVGQWIRSCVSGHYDSRSSAPEVSALTATEFFAARNILEEFGDLSMLADILSHAANANDMTVLSSAADTLNRHFNAFRVIGASNSLFRSLFEAFLRARQNGQSLYDLTFPLVEVGHRLPSEINNVIVLRQELSRTENKFAVAASSPVSDHMPETLNESGAPVTDDLDQLLSSGIHLDEGTMATVFQKLTDQLVQAKSLIDTCRQMVQLRSFNAKHFDLMMIRWIAGVLQTSNRPKLSAIIAPLVGVGCVTLSAFALLVAKLHQTDSARESMVQMPELQVDILELISPTSNKGSFVDLLSYRFRAAQEEFLLQNAKAALCIVKISASILSRVPTNDVEKIKPAWEAHTTAVLRELLVRHPEDLAQKYIHHITKQYPFTVGVVQQTLDNLLGRGPRYGNNSHLPEAEAAISLADNFSLPIFQMKLQLLFNTDGSEDVKNQIVDAMFDAAVADVRSGQSNWLDLVRMMSEEAVQQIRRRAEQSLFSVAQSDSSLDHAQSDKGRALRDDARAYLTIVDGLAYSVPESGVPSTIPLLVERLGDLLQKMVLAQIDLRNMNGSRNAAELEDTIRSLTVRQDYLVFWLTAMLRMVNIHRGVFASASSTSSRANLQSDLSRLVVTICCIALSQPHLGVISRPNPDVSSLPMASADQQLYATDSLQTYALDTVACLVDFLADDTRLQCIRFLKERCPSYLHVQNDPRLLYLLGPVADSAGGAPHSAVAGSSPAPSTSSSTPFANPAPVPSGSTTPTPFPTASGGDDPAAIANRLRIQSRGQIDGTFPFRSWEMLEEAAPMMGTNDTAIDLTFFGARRVRE